jgi:undecaprenyl pyrophosphate synthase
MAGIISQLVSFGLPLSPGKRAYADVYVVDTLWPDMRPEEFVAALRWYKARDVTLGG